MAQVKEGFNGKHILVTGGAGFVGSRLVQRLLTLNANVTVLIGKETSNVPRVKKLINEGKIKLVRCDLTGKEISEMKSLWKEMDLLAHLGLSIPRSSNFYDRAIEDINLNLLSTLNLIKAIGGFIKGICFASSVMVYELPAKLPIKEKHPTNPTTIYGATKLAVEKFLQVYSHTIGVPVTILRYSTIYGPGELKHRAIPNFIRSVINDEPPVIYGEGLELRDYVYIDDVVEATILALQKKPRRVFNIGSGKGYSTLEVARKIIQLSGKKLEPKYVPRPKEVIDIVCDISAANRELLYSTRVDLEEGLAREMKWYRKVVQGGVLYVQQMDRAKVLNG